MIDLNTFLSENLKDAKKLAILGIGSPLRTDDAAGNIVAENLQKHFLDSNHKNVRIYCGQSAPENHTGEIKKFKPSHLLVIDAVEMGEEPGSILDVQLDIIAGVTFSTHMLPIKVMLDYLADETNCKIIVLGIQVENLDYCGNLTPKVNEAVNYITDYIREKILQMD